MSLRNNFIFNLVLFVVLYATLSFNVFGEQNKMQFSLNEKSNWIFFTDGVMGGVSSGKMGLLNEENNNFIRLEGNVSTENNGGFIQIRHEISNLSDELRRIKLYVRGNNEKYHVFIRTKKTLLPWQFYSADFLAKNNWSNVELSLDDFKKSGFLLSSRILPSDIKSIGIVAYGRDFEALIDIKEIHFLN